MPARRFPPPWSVEELDACFAVRDHNGQQLAYVYFEDEPGRRSAAKLLTKDEAGEYCKGAGTVPPVRSALWPIKSNLCPKIASFQRLDLLHKGHGLGCGGHLCSRSALSVSHERSNKSAPQSPRCPGCAQIMRLAGITSRFDDLPDLYTFECSGCGVSHIEAAPFAVKLDPIEGNQLSETASLPTLFSRLDVLEDGQLLRACRKRLRVH
jgi:hypothetical protein